MTMAPKCSRWEEEAANQAIVRWCGALKAEIREGYGRDGPYFIYDVYDHRRSPRVGQRARHGTTNTLVAAKATASRWMRRVRARSA